MNIKSNQSFTCVSDTVVKTYLYDHLAGDKEVEGEFLLCTFAPLGKQFFYLLCFLSSGHQNASSGHHRGHGEERRRRRGGGEEERRTHFIRKG